jgi:hypothetical protein
VKGSTATGIEGTLHAVGCKIRAPSVNSNLFGVSGLVDARQPVHLKNPSTPGHPGQEVHGLAGALGFVELAQEQRQRFSGRVVALRVTFVTPTLRSAVRWGSASAGDEMAGLMVCESKVGSWSRRL